MENPLEGSTPFRRKKAPYSGACRQVNPGQESRFWGFTGITCFHSGIRCFHNGIKLILNKLTTISHNAFQKAGRVYGTREDQYEEDKRSFKVTF